MSGSAEQPTVTETPAVVVEAPAVAIAEAPAVVLHTDTPTLLGELKSPEPPVPAVEPAAPAAEAPAPDAEPAAEPPKPVDAAAEPKPADAPAEPAAEPAAAEPIVYPEWKMPEGVAPDKDKLSKYNEILGANRVSPEVGQALLDHYTASMQQFRQEYAEHTSREQHRVFGETREGWRKEVMADPEIGGAGHQTAMGAIARVRDVLVSSAKPGTPQYDSDMSAFNDALAITGMGDHPILLKMLHRAARFIDEPGMPPVNIGAPPNGGMPKGRGMAAIYKNSNGQGG